tara:strand:- start:152 stop:283 length:132 start_codon:yes stop_codon:yes gene_type:complete
MMEEMVRVMDQVELLTTDKVVVEAVVVVPVKVQLLDFMVVMVE